MRITTMAFSGIIGLTTIAAAAAVAIPAPARGPRDRATQSAGTRPHPSLGRDRSHPGISRQPGVSGCGPRGSRWAPAGFLLRVPCPYGAGEPDQPGSCCWVQGRGAGRWLLDAPQ